MKRTVLIITALMLCACADAESSSVSQTGSSAPQAVTSESVTRATTLTESAVPAETAAPPEKTETVKAELVSLKNGQIVLELDGKEQTYEVSDSVFNDLGGVKTARLIINNRYGEKIPAAVRFNSEKTRIASCKLLLERFMGDFKGSKASNPTDDEKLLKLEKLDNTRLRIYNKLGSVEADIRDLDIDLMGRYPEASDDVQTMGYYLPSGRYLAELVTLFAGNQSDGGYDGKIYDSPSTYKYPRFFGTIKSLSADRATVLLTDAKTTCDVPTYFNDGELKEGMDVMLVLDTDASLFGSGQSFKDDYAVFYTEPKEYLLKKYDDLSKLAYAKLDANNANKYIVTTVEELETDSEN